MMVAFSPETSGGKFSMAVLRMMNAMQTGPASPENCCVANLKNVSMRGGL